VRVATKGGVGDVFGELNGNEFALGLGCPTAIKSFTFVKIILPHKQCSRCNYLGRISTMRALKDFQTSCINGDFAGMKKIRVKTGRMPQKLTHISRNGCV
jgi:hypothetical protein